MIKKYENKMLKLNTPLAGHKGGSTIPVKVDRNGIPVEKYWRDRLKDSKIDKCVEFAKKTISKEILDKEDAKETKPKKSSKKTKTNNLKLEE